MTQISINYKFHYDSGLGNAHALISLLKEGWIIENYFEEDGYTWLNLGKTITD